MGGGELLQFDLFVMLAPFAAGVSALAIIVSWVSRRAPGFRALIAYQVACLGFIIVNTLELVDPSLEGTLFWAKLGYLFVGLVPVVWYAFAREYAGRGGPLLRQTLALLLVIPAFSLFLVFTNEAHLLVWRAYDMVPVGAYLHMRVRDYGPWFWVFSAYGYALFIGGTWLIVREFARVKSVFRRQALIVVTGALVPAFTHAVYMFKLIPGFVKNYSPIAYAVAGVCFTVGAFRYRLFDLMPVARSLAVERLADGIILADERGRLVDANPAASALIGLDLGQHVGASVLEFAPFLAPFYPEAAQGGERRLCARRPALTELPAPFEVSWRCGDLALWLEVAAARVEGRGCRSRGLVISLRDITRLRALVAENAALARTDALTGLKNRRAFEELAEREALRAERHNAPLGLLVVDLDRFKAINDERGHLAGDHVLASFAAAMSASLREADVVARLGGDEFVALLPEVDEAGLVHAATRIVAAARALTLKFDGAPLPCTVSVGAALMSFDRGGNDTRALIEVLFARADAALYEAKRSGGDTYSIAPQPA